MAGSLLRCAWHGPVVLVPIRRGVEVDWPLRHGTFPVAHLVNETGHGKAFCERLVHLLPPRSGTHCRSHLAIESHCRSATAASGPRRFETSCPWHIHNRGLNVFSQQHTRGIGSYFSRFLKSPSAAILCLGLSVQDGCQVAAAPRFCKLAVNAKRGWPGLRRHIVDKYYS